MHGILVSNCYVGVAVCKVMDFSAWLMDSSWWQCQMWLYVIMICIYYFKMKLPVVFSDQIHDKSTRTTDILSHYSMVPTTIEYSA